MRISVVLLLSQPEMQVGYIRKALASVTHKVFSARATIESSCRKILCVALAEKFTSPKLRYAIVLKNCAEKKVYKEGHVAQQILHQKPYKCPTFLKVPYVLIS
jgi:hypothetical protein